MLRLSGSFRRRILISSTIAFPIVGLLALIRLTGSYIRVKGQLFDPEQEFSLLLERLDVQERVQEVQLGHQNASIPDCSTGVCV